MSTLPQNLTEIIEFYSDTPTWTFQTKVLLIFSDPQTLLVQLPHMEILKTFSDAGLFNVVTLQFFNSSKDCLVTSYDPYTKEITTRWNPINYLLVFREKVQDIRGHQVNLKVVEHPPEVIIQEGKIFGIAIDLFDLFLRHINGSRIDLVDLEDDPFGFDSYHDMMANRQPYIDKTNYHQVPANDQDQLRIMTRYRKSHWSSHFLNSHFLNGYAIILLVSFLVYSFVHHVIFCRGRSTR